MSDWTDFRDQVEVGLGISNGQDAAHTAGAVIRQATPQNNSTGTPTASPVPQSFFGGASSIPKLGGPMILGVSAGTLALAGLAGFAIWKLLKGR